MWAHPLVLFRRNTPPIPPKLGSFSASVWLMQRRVVGGGVDVEFFSSERNPFLLAPHLLPSLRFLTSGRSHLSWMPPPTGGQDEVIMGELMLHPPLLVLLGLSLPLLSCSALSLWGSPCPATPLPSSPLGALYFPSFLSPLPSRGERQPALGGPNRFVAQGQMQGLQNEIP